MLSPHSLFYVLFFRLAVAGVISLFPREPEAALCAVWSRRLCDMRTERSSHCSYVGTLLFSSVSLKRVYRRPPRGHGFGGSQTRP